MKAYTSIIFFIMLTFTACKKNAIENICKEVKQPTGKFIIREVLGDTAFAADTIFRDNYVQFQAIDTY